MKKVDTRPLAEKRREQVFSNLTAEQIIDEAEKQGITLFQRPEWSAEFSVKVHLVSHGYQIDFFDNAGSLIGSSCRDFGGSHDPTQMQTTVIAGFLATMCRAEFHFKRGKMIDGFSEKQIELAVDRCRQIRKGILAAIIDVGSATQSITAICQFLSGYYRINKSFKQPSKTEIKGELDMLVNMGAVQCADGRYGLL
jgi:hypothetical protein